MIIDAHSHVLVEPKIKYSPVLSAFMSAAEQIELMDRMGVDKAVILPLVNPEINVESQSISEVLGICRKYPGRFIAYCNVDPRLIGGVGASGAEHFEFILRQYKELGCKGLGELAARLEWEDVRVLDLLAACEKVGFPVTFHTSLSESSDYGIIDIMGLGGLEKVLQRFTGLRILGHSQAFWAEISGDVKPEQKSGYPNGQVKPGGAVVRLLRNYPNLMGDLSANSGLNSLKRDPAFAYEFIDEFQDQLVFGLDCCLYDCDREHVKWFNEAKEGNRISQQAYDKIMYRNISRILQP